MTLFAILRHSARIKNRGDHCPRRHSTFRSQKNGPDSDLQLRFGCCRYLFAYFANVLFSVSIETEVVSWLFQRSEYNVCEGIKYKCNRRRKNINCNRLFGCKIEAQITVELWGPLYDRTVKIAGWAWSPPLPFTTHSTASCCYARSVGKNTRTSSRRINQMTMPIKSNPMFNQYLPLSNSFWLGDARLLLSW